MRIRKARLFVPLVFAFGLMCLAVGVLQGAGLQIAIGLVMTVGLAAFSYKSQIPRSRPVLPWRRDQEPANGDSKVVLSRLAGSGAGRVLALSVLLASTILAAPGVAYPASPQAPLDCTPGPHSGTISENEKWCKDNSHILEGDVTVSSGVTLTIDTGVVVKGESNTQLNVRGHLEAVGTTSDKITFTSASDSGPGEWAGLKFYSNGTGNLEHVIVRNGGQTDHWRYSNITVTGVQTGKVRIAHSVVESVKGPSNADDDYGLHVYDSQVEVIDTTFRGNGDDTNDYALYVQGSNSVVTVTNSIFQENLGDGMAIRDGQASVSCSTFMSNTVGVRVRSGGSPAVVVNDSNIHGNGVGVHNENAGMTVDARDNWWGDSSGPTHPGNSGGTGDDVVYGANGGAGTVDYTGYLATESPCALLEPDIVATPNPVDFGDVLVGDTVTQTVTVSNGGTADLHIGSVTLPAAPFSITNDACSGQTLPPAGDCDIEIQFAPTTVGAFADSIPIASDDPDEPSYVVDLQGTGVSGSPPDFTLACDPTSLDILQGESGTSICTVTSLEGFNDEVDLTCEAGLTGVTCSLNPTQVTPPSNGEVRSTLTVIVESGAPVGSGAVRVTGTSGLLSHSTTVEVNVVPPSELRAETLAVDKPHFVPSQSLGESLAGSSNQNRVLEPGESVIVEPGWTNLGSAPVDVTGKAVTFTGPGDAGYYAIQDDAADYGIIGFKETANCYDATGNCYELGVADPPSRPARHWDTIFEESLSADSIPAASSSNTLDNTSNAEFTKRWTVHVGESFDDVLTTHEAYVQIETLFHHGITFGCSEDPSLFCPDSPTTRGQAAVLIALSLEAIGALDTTACNAKDPSPFGDVPNDHPACRYTKALYKARITFGCGAGNYCPTDPMTRGQLAVLLGRALVYAGLMAEPALCTVDNPSPFDDVPNGHPACRYIKALYEANVVAGCDSNNYCPADDAPRWQSAMYIANGFEFELYGPEVSPGYILLIPDFNDDGGVDATDVQIIAAAWRQSPPLDPRHDRNGDGAVRIDDVMDVVSQWGQ